MSSEQMAFEQMPLEKGIAPMVVDFRNFEFVG
jgi:hypothetical protein